MDRWDRLDKFISRVERFVLATLLSLMILVAFLQIVLRNFFTTGMSWGDSLVRYLVLWVGFIGAALAAREGKHITIDVFSRWVPGLGTAIARLITHLFSTIICTILAYAAIKFIRNEAQMGNVTLLGFPIWIIQIILPIAFALMALRFGRRLYQAFSSLLKRSHSGRLRREV